MSRMSRYTYTSICACVCMVVNLENYIKNEQVHICSLVCVCVCLCICIHDSDCQAQCQVCPRSMQRCAYIYIYIYIYIHTHTHTYIHTYIYAYLAGQSIRNGCGGSQDGGRLQERRRQGMHMQYSSTRAYECNYMDSNTDGGFMKNVTKVHVYACKFKPCSHAVF
jgi:hypothetical protein